MTERDAFENRLRAALLRHVADGPTEFDAGAFARMVAAKEPRRRGIAAALAWRRVAIPQVAWILLLVGLLLVAMVAGALVVGSQLERKLPAVVPPIGPAFACPPGSTPDKPGPVDQARPALPTLAFDREAGRVVGLAGALTGVVETWTFDVCTNTWTQMHPNGEPPVSGWGPHLVYDVDSHVTIGVTSGSVWAYDLAADTWTRKGVAPTYVTLRAYDPVSGLVVAARTTAPTALWNYDVETDTWTPIRKANGPDYGSIAYDASVDRMIAYGSQTWLFDIRAGTWSLSRADTPAVAYGMAPPPIEYAEAAARTVVYGNGRLAAFDAAEDRWEVLVERAPGRPDSVPLAMVYDPVNERLVGCGWPADTVVQGDVVAFDLVTRKWTVLLEPSDGQPAPSTK
jgi:hypothetical protein